ncbi:MAG: energy transducer TonB [Acidobacteriaceae bacterium]
MPIEVSISADVSLSQPMLAHAAPAAVSRARCQPYKLNGEPVEVDTTISIDFVLGSPWKLNRLAPSQWNGSDGAIGLVLPS